ncbi:S8 family serine peptidase [Flavobacterium cerinum]|uniref:S8 family serine peptidase n=1 Tax=Flavobacterium cerinum TaxID=2502784 RepID=A0ABY5IPS8_9FLAO|nr:S8 family serine peptidase [Flavobacterium cerinum]UUC44291.1 S8 family serine peptidase [Flavobacterium cerinum]
MMKRFFTLLLVLTQGIVFSQEDAWVYFKDKPDSQHFLNNPLLMLSQRALNRRIAQNIALEDRDVPVYQPYVKQITDRIGITVMAKSKWLNALHIRGAEMSIKELSQLTCVERIDFANKSLNTDGGIVSAHKDNNKAVFTKLAAVQSDFQSQELTDTQIQMLNGHLLHQEGYTGNGKMIAVTDSGFVGVDTDDPFKRIRDNNKIKGSYNFVTRSENVYGVSDHGTMVLSTMAAHIENRFNGTAPDASYYLFTTEIKDVKNPIEESLWVEAAEKSDSLGVDIINASLGHYKFDNPAYDYTDQNMDGKTTFISRGAEMATKTGMIVVASAGDLGNSEWKFITAPADVAGVLSVGAVNSIKQRLNFSSYGPTSDGRLKPDVMALGFGVQVINGTEATDSKNGTSFSAPTVAGLIACLWQALPGKTNKEIVALVKESADRYQNPNNFYGYGIPDFYKAIEEQVLATHTYTLNEFKLYPNPTDALITIRTSGNKNTVFLLYNNVGQEIIRQQLTGLEETTVSMENLESGLYLYTIVSDERTFSGKIIKK